MGKYKIHVLSIVPMHKIINAGEKTQFSKNHDLWSITQHAYIFEIL